MVQKIFDFLRNAEWSLALWDYFFGKTGVFKDWRFTSGMGILAMLLGIIQQLPWMLVFIGGLAAWAFALWIRQLLSDGNRPRSAQISGAAPRAASEQEKKLPFASVTLLSRWAGQPFVIVVEKEKRGIQGEDVVVKFTANERLDNVRVRFRVQDFRNRDLVTFDLPDRFNGPISKGISEEVSVASVHFMKMGAEVKNGPTNLEGHLVPYRHDLKAVVFEGTTAERELALNAKYKIVIELYEGDKAPLAASFDWELSRRDMPLAQIRNLEGPIDVEGPHYARPGGWFYG